MPGPVSVVFVRALANDTMILGVRGVILDGGGGSVKWRA